MSKSLYDILGVTEHATTEELKQAYRRLVIRYHPDKNPGDTEAEEIFKEIAYAYRILNDPGSRLLYDNTGKAERPKIENEIKGAIFSAFQEALSKEPEPNRLQPQEIDIVAAARQFIQEGEARIRAQQELLTIRKNKLELNRNKVKTKADVNLFHQLVDAELKNINQALEQCSHQLEIGKGCYAVLDEYEYEMSKPRYSHGIIYKPTGYTISFLDSLDGLDEMFPLTPQQKHANLHRNINKKGEMEKERGNKDG